MHHENITCQGWDDTLCVTNNSQYQIMEWTKTDNRQRLDQHSTFVSQLHHISVQQDNLPSIWSTLLSLLLPWLDLRSRGKSWRTLKVSNLLQCFRLYILFFANNIYLFFRPSLYVDYTFEQFVTDFNHNYSPEEHAVRKGLFDAELARVIKHNAAKKGSWEEVIRVRSRTTVSYWPSR